MSLISEYRKWMHHTRHSRKHIMSNRPFPHGAWTVTSFFINSLKKKKRKGMEREGEQGKLKQPVGASSRCFTPKRVNSICRAWNWFKAFWWGKGKGEEEEWNIKVKRKSTVSSSQANWMGNGGWCGKHLCLYSHQKVFSSESLARWGRLAL